MPSWIRSLTKKYLNNPLTIDLVGDSDQKLADGITMYSISAESYGKAGIIGPLVAEHTKGGKCIVFTQTKRDADRLAYGLANTFKCEALHGVHYELPNNTETFVHRTGRTGRAGKKENAILIHGPEQSRAVKDD
ncbi:unnamed protein product [Microthlaspi erraticum]|uniref:Helicase C-terminal domain-containing protein n=1 Tax=Microthlaspi erraticum TaxID=1685480 RepID=A0A6D2IW20_9BRAS|nr:unnamed protein product [Microthlaspi erraticum]